MIAHDMGFCRGRADAVSHGTLATEFYRHEGIKENLDAETAKVL